MPELVDLHESFGYHAFESIYRKHAGTYSIDHGQAKLALGWTAFMAIGDLSIGRSKVIQRLDIVEKQALDELDAHAAAREREFNGLYLVGISSAESRDNYIAQERKLLQFFRQRLKDNFSIQRHVLTDMFDAKRRP